MMYTLKRTNVYRVPTVEDALRLRKWLDKNCIGELTSFKYATKYIKAKGEIIEEYQLVKAKIEFTPEKDPEQHINVTYEEGI